MTNSVTTVDQIIKTLASFDLSSCDPQAIIDELRKLGKLALFGLNVKAGQFVVRSRCDESFKNYDCEDQITYIKDRSIIPAYNRASLEGDSIFYGCIPAYNTNDEHHSQVLSVAEVSRIIDQESDQDLEEYATMGKWRVIKDFTACAIAHNKDFMSEDPELKNMHEFFLNMVKQSPEKEYDFIRIAEYLSNEFAKPVQNDRRFEYKISGAFSKIVFAIGGAGVIYPSAKNMGKGFNIALPPSTVDNHLKLEKVAVWKINKREKNMLIHPHLVCDAFTPDNKFIWRDTGVVVPPGFIEESLSK